LATSIRSLFVPVCVMAGRAVLEHRRVLPQERPALLGVAADAALVNRGACLEQLHVGAAMHVVARRAAHLAFTNRHVVEPVLLVRDVLVAGRAQFDFGLRLELGLLALRRVDAMAACATHIPVIVLAAGPQCMGLAIVAGRASIADLTRRHCLDRADLRLVATRFGVGFASPVAALAALSGRWRLRVEGLGMGAALDRGGLVFVTAEAGV
jgi:hypothetical protein